MSVRELPDNFFSEDEFLNLNRGDVFVGYGPITDGKSPVIEDYLHLPRSHYEVEHDLVHEPIEIPQTDPRPILLDASDSGSDSGISGEHPKVTYVSAFSAVNQNGTDVYVRNMTPSQRDTMISPPYLSTVPAYVISKQPTSLKQSNLSHSGLQLLSDEGTSRNVVVSSKTPLTISDQFIEAESVCAFEHPSSVNSASNSSPMTGLVLTADDLLMGSNQTNLTDEELANEMAVVKEEPMNPKMHSILQSKVRIQPRPNLKYASAPAGTDGASNYRPVAKRVRSSANVKTVVPTMMTGEDTAEIVYTPQTTYVLSSGRDSVSSLPHSLHVKSEPYFSVAGSVEQPKTLHPNLEALNSTSSSQVAERIYLITGTDDQQSLSYEEEQLSQQNLTTADYIERGRLAKKQERMIKNRQAASLSRQRKKEYLETLEGTLDALRRENRDLRKSNQDIRRRYEDLMRKMTVLEKQSQNFLLPKEGCISTSSPRNAVSSSSSYISSSSINPPVVVQAVVCNPAAPVSTHSLPTLTSQPSQAKRIINGLSSETVTSSIITKGGNIKFSPHLRRKVPTVTTTLAASSVLAFFCLLVLNINPLLSLTNSVPLISSYQSRSRALPKDTSAGLSSASSFANSIGVNSFSRQFARSSSRTLLSLAMKSDSFEDGSPSAHQRRTPHPQCPVVPFNSTESSRVAFELNRWAAQYKKEAKLAFLRNIWYQRASDNWRRRRWEPSSRRMHTKRPYGGRQTRHDVKNAIQIHKTAGDPRMDQLMFGFRRQNDTMYFVSLTGDHFIFPALNTSKSKLSRPKISFIMPAVFGLNDTVRPGRDRVAMMQIDCEIVNYTVFHVDKRHLSSYVKLNEFRFTSGRM